MKRSSALSRPASASTSSSRTVLDPLESSIEAFGQYEKITTRLKRLLDQYTDGFAVLKELVQNADDAGATEVRFLYDERANNDAMTHLLDEGMKECQGPALWVYNDAEFTEKDFENIEKLSGATKEHHTEKIGKFGLGFNAVYNLTDVPMFLSKNYFVVFDPHMSHLRRHIKNPAKPGVRINLNKNPEALRARYRGQFKPFDGIFGCDLRLSKKDNSFRGTLFRFPLRTREQARRSEIKQLYYNDQEMRKLLRMLLEGAESLLLFTQNILRVGIYNLPCASSPDAPLLLFQVTKSLSSVGILRELSSHVTLPTTAEKLSKEEKRLLQESNFLQVASRFMEDLRNDRADVSNSPRSSVSIEIDCNLTKRGVDFFGGGLRCGHEKTTWLVVSSMGRGKAMSFIMDHHDTTLVPTAGVAVRLISRDLDVYVPSPVVKNIDGVDANGSIFCYLPLPIHSGLPVHINGAFAVAADRRNLERKVEDDKSYHGVNWNKVLMKDSVCTAYLALLDDLKLLVTHGDSYQFHLLWPKSSTVQHSCRFLMKSFYKSIANEGSSLFSDGRQWVDINSIVFLDPKFREASEIGDAAFEVLQLHYRSARDTVVIDLPSDILMSFEKSNQERTVNNRKCSEVAFYRRCFFPHMPRIPVNIRDLLMLHELDHGRDFDSLMEAHACIPVSPYGKTLKCPSQLVNPRKEVAALFSSNEGKFPFGNEASYRSPQRLTKLEGLGMCSDDLPWSEVAERAESIQRLNMTDPNAALERVEELLKFMERKIKRERRKKKMAPSSKIREYSLQAGICQRLLQAKFLPVLRKPENFPLPWKGDAFEGKQQVLLSPKEMFLQDKKYLVCCSEPLVGISLPRNVEKCLKLDTKDASLSHVTQQIQCAMSTDVNLLNVTKYQEVTRICHEAYKYLNKIVRINGDECMKFLHGKNFILVERRFLSAKEVAFELTADCAPYLYKLPQQLTDTFPEIMEAAGVKEVFDREDYISSLQKIKSQFEETKLDEQTLQVSVNLTLQLSEVMNVSEMNPSQVQKETVFLPDSKGVMRAVSDLCIRNCPWIGDEPDVHYVNDRIPWPTCQQVGVKTRREEALQSHAIGLPCGQTEKLANRLRRILTEYPCEKEILKELVQNADDAQATEICFIKDPRYHPKERIFEDSWQPLQGPALCVYNNKPFTKADIDGIQNLGEGSKGGDPCKTGEYGVGFNAVYHLTDAPSFISKGGDVGDVLLVFDPDCRYAPGASPEKPGRMFKVSEKIQKDFPDVFRCYLGELERFSGDNSTIFRFPLRSEEMAIGSKISSRPVTLEKLDRMMEELKRELFEVLLFVDNVKKITLCEVEKTSGKLVDYYTVEVMLTEEDEEERKYFAAVIKEVGNLIKQGQILPTDSPVVKVSYMLKITDNCGNEEKWLIVQQIGFQGDVKSTIVDAFMKQKLGMLPRGGVACLLEKKCLESPVQRRKKAFCFLPLPLETNLPVHINGHFALDHESRRNLWRDEAGHVGYRSDWNNALLEDVVASCYIDMLGKVQRLLGFGLNRSTETEVLAKIRTLESLFPQKPTTDQYWKTLVDSVYQGIDKRKLNLLPVVRHSAQRGKSFFDVTWLPPTGMGKQKAFFNNLADAGPFAKPPEKAMEEAREKRRKKFEGMLVRSGFNLVAFSMKMHDSFKRSGVVTSCISASDLIEFYRTFGSHDPLCTIGPIPCDVSKTVFKDDNGVKLVLLFCKEADDFLDKLPGLPLLLTQDKCLQSFSNVNPKFLSRFKDLLPGSPQIFLHEEIYRNIFCTADTSKLTVLKPLDADAFGANLAETLPREIYGKSKYVNWSPAQKGLPDQRWICRVWEFLYDITQDVLNDKEIDDEDTDRQVKAAIHPLLDWSILPVTQMRSSRIPLQVDHFLVPLRWAQGAIHMPNVDAASTKLVKVLRKLGIPELNQKAISRTISTIMYSSSTSLAVPVMLVSSLKDPSSLLVSLRYKWILNQQEIRERLVESDCKEILEYFSLSVSCLQETDKSNLRKLPFYLATNGGFMSLEKVKVSALPTGVPKNGIDALERALGMAFVKSWPGITDLFKFLELTCISAVDVYCDSILPSFNLLGEEARLVHLEHIRDTILTDSTGDDEEKERLLNILKCTPLIPSENGTLKMASCVYDPNNDVFKAMLSSDFPPEPFDSPEWISFLRQVGLVSEVSSVDFKRFAREVEHEALTVQTEKTHEKSRTLVDHLISRHDVVGEGLLNAIRDIAFVVADPVAHPLQQLCPPFKQKQEDHVPYIPFKGAVFANYEEIVWTQAHLLPTWANPELCWHQLGRPPLASVDKYCDAFVSQLQIIKKPPIDIVLRHCEVLCHHLENLRKCKLDLSEHRRQITNVMEQIYEFLQDNADERGIIVLEFTPCILVENGTKFVRPGEAVVELQAKDEIKPFLYRVPPELGKFRELFQTLGCYEFVTCAHYAVVLENLQKNCCDAKLHPNELKMCFKAVKGFFETLQEKSEEASALSKLSTLYLPATPSGIRCLENNLNTISVTLHKSSELVFNDLPAYEDRVKGLHQHFLLDLKLMKVRVTLTMTNFKELMMKLPLHLRPKMLSLVVREKLIDGVFVKSSVFDSMMLRLCTPQFGQGIARIIKHDNSQKSDFNEDVIADIEKSLKRIQLCAMDSLKTALFLDDDLIPGSERDTKSFQEKCEVPGEEKCMVYVNVENAANDTELARSLVSRVIIDIYGDLLGKSAFLVPGMLRCAPNEIWSLLDKSGIRQDDTCSVEDMDIFPEPGSFIPVEDHHLLNDAFGNFEPGEYVGYQLHDPSLQLDRGVATFIYAVIIEEVMAQDVSCNEDWVLHLVTKVYSVDIGHEHEPVEVTAAKLYKFCRFEEISNAQRRNREDRDEVLLQISTILENAWKCDLPEGERRQIVKRVILRWRPEKNIGDEEFCFEVSKHIRDELFRLGGSHEEFIDACVEIAKEHRTRREVYQEKVLQQYTSQGHLSDRKPWRNVPPSFSRSNPQPGEAKRWYKQAEADLVAGGNEIDSGKPSYEWVCFKCHQVKLSSLSKIVRT